MEYDVDSLSSTLAACKGHSPDEFHHFRKYVSFHYMIYLSLSSMSFISASRSMQ